MIALDNYVDLVGEFAPYLKDAQIEQLDQAVEKVKVSVKEFENAAYIEKNKDTATQIANRVKNTEIKAVSRILKTSTKQDDKFKSLDKRLVDIEDALIAKLDEDVANAEDDKDLVSEPTEEEQKEREIKKPVSHREATKSSKVAVLIEPQNEAKDVVLHVDIKHSQDAKREYDSLKNVAGYKYPVLKVRNTTFTEPALQMFAFKVGYLFVPDIAFAVQDTNDSFLNTDYPIVDDIVTLYIGNQYDTENKPIHLDFRLSKVATDVNNGKTTHYFHCELAIENAFARLGVNKESTTFELIQELCKEMKLGLVTNITKSDDKMFYRQHSKTNIEFLEQLCNSIYVDDDAVIHCFIDQHFRLNVIDVDKVLNSRPEPIMIEKDLTYFEQLEKPQQVIINNNMYGDHGTEFNFTNCVPANNTFATQQMHKPIESAVIKKDYKAGQITSTVKNTNVKAQDGKHKDVLANKATESIKTQTVSMAGVDNDNSKQLGSKANSTKLQYLINNMYLNVELEKVSNVLHMHQLVPFMFYSKPAATTIPSAPKDKNLDTTLPPISDSGAQELIENMSDDYTIAGMHWLYEAGGALTQGLKLVRQSYEPQLYNLENDLNDLAVGLPDPYSLPPELPMPVMSTEPGGTTGGNYSYNPTLGDYMAIARGELGQKEFPGASHNPRIQDYHRASGFGNNAADEVHWCASFVSWVMIKAGYGRGKSNASAASWASYGVPCAPGTVGAIIVMKFKPGPVTSSGNHVAFCTGMSNGRVQMLGGNQGAPGAVTNSSIPLGNIWAWRLPSGTPSAPVQNTANSLAPAGPMKISAAGLKFLKDKEGCKLTAYQCSADRWTIGYGHTKTAKPGMTISYQQADALLAQDLQFFEGSVNKLVKVKLTQSMYDALVCYIYNCGAGKLGPSTALNQLLNKGQYKEAADCLLKPNTAKGKIIDGLTTRRNQERAMFMSQGLSPR